MRRPTVWVFIVVFLWLALADYRNDQHYADLNARIDGLLRTQDAQKYKIQRLQMGATDLEFAVDEASTSANNAAALAEDVETAEETGLYNNQDSDN